MNTVSADHECSACTGPPPAACPQCETVILGATPSDWREHFETDCAPLGVLYCFVPTMEVLG